MKTLQIKSKKLPDSPGVYFFLNKNKKPIYIGKATSLKDRVKSYFSKDLFATRGPLLVKMMSDAKTIDFKVTDSVLEALILEADLIKKFHPIYNTKEKDDKSFNCVVITDEDFPRLLVIRKKEIDFSLLQTSNYKLQTVFGPYPNGLQLQAALKIVRRIFPWRDNKCIPAQDQIAKGKTPRPCFNRQIGLCPGVCTGEISKKDYAKIIHNLKLFFQGKKQKLILSLEKDMREFAKEKEFEKAGKVKKTIYSLNHIQDVALIKSDSLQTKNFKLQTSFRIESYDIAHMSGKNMVGVMVVIIDGIKDLNSYRKFNIKTVSSANDTGALEEVLTRRFAHPEWQKPDLVVVDGGIAQLQIAKSVIENLGIIIPVVSVVKDEKHRPKGFFGDEKTINNRKREIILSNSEAHRFAIAFHKKKRAKNFLPK